MWKSIETCKFTIDFSKLLVFFLGWFHCCDIDCMVCAAFTRPRGNRIERIMGFYFSPVSCFIRIGYCNLSTTLDILRFWFSLHLVSLCVRVHWIHVIEMLNTNRARWTKLLIIIGDNCDSNKCLNTFFFRRLKIEFRIPISSCESEQMLSVCNVQLRANSYSKQ